MSEMRRVLPLVGLILALAIGLAVETLMPANEAGDEIVAPKSAPVAGASHGAAQDVAPAPGKGGLDTVASAVVERPLFSPSRHAAPGAAAGANARSRDGPPRLTGVIVGPSGGRAIFLGPDHKPHSAAVGDTVDGYVVHAISPGRVTVSGSKGERVLRPTYSTSQGTGQDPDATLPPASRTAATLDSKGNGPGNLQGNVR